MSMLAEPRKKQKVINLRAKNNAWSKDSSKFGQRMLEKMGWTAGKGLGVQENGIVEHVVAKYKNDEKGFGFKDNNDQWTKHEDDFNSLLANLSNDDKSIEPVCSGVSLEEKSKKSKARVHYPKFTRGKDLSRYSEKDLANIFGKKSLKNTEESNEECSTGDSCNQVFTVKGSMLDYFNSKKTLKSKENISEPLSDENEEYAFQGFSQESTSDIKSIDDSKIENSQSAELLGSLDIKNKKSKKRKNVAHPVHNDQNTDIMSHSSIEKRNKKCHKKYKQ